MPTHPLSPEDAQRLEALLGYLNFSAGARDPQFLGQLNETYRWLGGASGNAAHRGAEVPCQEVYRQLLAKLDELQAGSETFR
ncbi:MAG: hypothetical protein GTO03_01495, partial [Planctomycetales bacterium]|nr:hypothetical protein [Planctomycetales bacterium]